MPLQHIPPNPDDSGERYEILRLLGQGGAGAVHLARDRETGGLVAIKKLLRMDPKSVLRLKREFRSLADVRHRNLIEFYNLVAGEDSCFLTMEFIDGTDLLAHLRSGLNDSQVHETKDGFATSPANANNRPEANVEPVLAVFQQLACGVRALHEAGMLHRDLKPSNVMVARGRVVVLDFGLVRDLDGPDVLVTQQGTISGTPAYMAPEQAAGEALGEATDWYAFGVMLFQALTGELPIEGRSATELIVRKTTNDSPPIEYFVGGLPRQLATLCNKLLDREPKKRPGGVEVLATLDRLLGQPNTQTTQLELTQTALSGGGMSLRVPVLVGRGPELEQLMAALHDTRAGGLVAVHVRGTSGAGKSTLVEQFLDSLESEEVHFSSSSLVLRSRCSEREAMPYKALDGIMDNLASYLLEQPDFELGRLLPDEVSDLARLFPVLQRIAGVRRMLEADPSRSEKVQTRVRGEAALRELFTRVARQRPLVLWIDDLQWGDLDSAYILKAWQEQPSSSPTLLVFTYRSDEVGTSPCLRELIEHGQRVPSAQNAPRIMEISPLDGAQVRELCERRLGSVALERPELVDKIAEESQGNPFLASQLTALVQAKLARGDLATAELSIEQLIGQSTSLVAPEAIRILNVLAVAGRPLMPKLALRAAGVGREGRAHLVALRSLRLIRARNTGDGQLIEVYHDRVREGVVAGLEPEARTRLQAELLDTLEQAQGSDAGWLFSLALGALPPSAALKYGLVAAARAESVLAFERGAALIQHCIELSEQVGEDTSQLRRRLAECLARAGHGVRAAEAYLAIAKDADPILALTFQRLAASHLLRSGEYARGDRIIRDVLAARGLSIPESDAAVLAAVVWERAVLAIRGLDFKPAAAPVPEETLAPILLYGTLASEYQAYDPVRTALFLARGMRGALAAGDRYTFARALCLSAVVACVNGSPRAARETDDMLARADALTKELGIDSLRADWLAAKTVTSYLLGRPHDILEPADEAERLYRTLPGSGEGGEYFHRFVVMAIRVGAHVFLGHNERAMSELAVVREEARVTNNRNAILQLSLVQTFVDGLRDDYASAKVRLIEERKLLPADRFGPLHTIHMTAVTRTACGLHDYTWADAWIEEDWNKWRRSLMRMSAFMSLLALASHLRYLVNRHVVQRRTENLERLVRPALKIAASIPMDEARIGLPHRTQARLDFLAGKRESAVAHLSKVVDGLEAMGARADAIRERFALALMRGGVAGAAEAQRCEQQMLESGVVNPRKDVLAFYPELRDA